MDDDAAVRNATGLLLRTRGFETKCFASGAEFLAAADLAQPGCVIVDQLMPGMLGSEIIEALASANSQIAAILQTGLADDETAGLGAFARIEKPASSEEIFAAVEAALARSLAQAER